MQGPTKTEYEEIEHLNRRITGKEIESVITNVPTNKSPAPNGFIGDSFHVR